MKRNQSRLVKFKFKQAFLLAIFLHACAGSTHKDTHSASTSPQKDFEQLDVKAPSDEKPSSDAEGSLGYLTNRIVSGISGDINDGSAIFTPLTTDLNGNPTDPETSLREEKIVWEIRGAIPSWLNCKDANTHAVTFRCRISPAASTNDEVLRLVLHVTQINGTRTQVQVFANFAYSMNQGVARISAPAGDPAYLRAVGITTNSVKIVWHNEQSAALAYVIDYATDAPPEEKCTSGVRMTGRSDFDLNDLKDNESYFIRVCGEGTSGNRSIGQVVAVRTHKSLSQFKVRGTSFTPNGYWLGWDAATSKDTSVQIVSMPGHIAPESCASGLKISDRPRYRVSGLQPNAVTSYRFCSSTQGDTTATFMSLRAADPAMLPVDSESLSLTATSCSGLQFKSSWKEPSTRSNGAATSGYLLAIRDFAGDRTQDANSPPVDCSLATVLPANVLNFATTAIVGQTYSIRLCSVDQFGNISSGVTKSVYVTNANPGCP